MMLGVRVLASEYATGRVHGGRIDSLGLDLAGVPVIIASKWSRSQNVITQGLCYLDWLLDHRAELTALTRAQLGPGRARAIDWRNPRLLCIAGDFRRDDLAAVHQIERRVDLLRCRRFGSEVLLLERLDRRPNGHRGTRGDTWLPHRSGSRMI
jgi:hypothetical protein